MKPFLYRLVPVFLFLCAACTEADIVSPGPVVAKRKRVFLFE